LKAIFVYFKSYESSAEKGGRYKHYKPSLICNQMDFSVFGKVKILCNKFDMANQQIRYVKDELQYVIPFLWSQGVKIIENYGQIAVQ
jgi:hypothetical protein